MAVVAAFVGLTVVRTFPLVLNLRASLPADLGDPLLNAWILAWDADRLRGGLRGLWDAPIFFPYPKTLGYSEHLLGIAVFTAPLQWLTENPLLVYNLAFLASYALAGVGMYLLVRSLTGRRDAAFVAGAAFAFGPFRDGQIAHLQMLMSGWMPIALWALHRYFASGRRWALGAFVVTFLIQGLSNGYFLYFFSVPVALVLGHGLWKTCLPRGRVLAELAVVGLLMLAVLAPVGLMYHGLSREQPFARSRGSIVNGSADLFSYTQTTDRVWMWRGVFPVPPRRIRGALFPGATMLLMASVGLASGWRRRDSPGGAPTSFRRRFPGLVPLYGAIFIVAFALSLGPEPRVWGQPLGIHGPYEWFLRLVPGLDGLRVPSRMSVVVFVALAALSGFGVASLGARLSRSGRTAACGILVTAILVEGHAPLRCLEFSLGPNDVRVYDWLRAAPSGGVLELPIRTSNQQTLRYQFATLRHQHPIVNGYSGHRSSLSALFAESNSIFADSNLGHTTQGLRDLGVRYIVVHTDLFPDPSFANSIVRTLRADRRQTLEVLDFGPTTVVRLAAVAHADSVRASDHDVPIPTFRVSASREEGTLPLALDGVLESRWETRRRQRGDEWVQIELDPPRDVSRIRLEHGRRTWKSYPRGLRIEASADGERFEVLFEGEVLDRLITGIVQDSRSAPLDFHLPPNRAVALRLHQTGRTGSNPWAISELTLWERRGGP